MSEAPPIVSYEAYRKPVEDVIASLRSDAQRGLSTAEARERLARYGRNELLSEPPIPAWRRFVAQFQNVLVILLLVATVVSVLVWLYERESALPYEGIAIFTIVLLNGILGFVQEERAEKSVAALQAMAAAGANVLRDGERQTIPAAEVVPGDILLLEEGDTVSADARLISAVRLQTAEAALTGESLPISKSTAPLDEESSLGDRTNMVFSGTAATYGRGAAIVTSTGMQTEMGRVAGMLQQTEDEETPLQRELNRTGRLLGGIVLVIAVVIVATILLVEDVSTVSDIVDVLILGVALAVAAVPEGLPAIVTAVLAIGVQRMVQRKALAHFCCTDCRRMRQNVPRSFSHSQ
jgi:Ca2+-transporting ATPase